MADFFPQVGIIQIQLVSSTKFTKSYEFPAFSENPAEFRRLQAAGRASAVVEEVRNLLYPFLLLLLRIPGVSRKYGRVPASSGGRKSSGGGGRGGEESPIPLSPSPTLLLLSLHFCPLGVERGLYL
ncbi:hypothetical protein KFK09_002278 [Dendrobium nobile]|uniref:Uncharacterized protein n=1 Tax=Dendrobium nobile TaxID=94219 RepID=A0A8T3CCI4_DENNO|nr:hypothetical protein KFK09_002278 [Dendrobium nobile]